MTVDGLSEYGMEPMSDANIRSFLSSRSTGVLGLPTGAEPMLRPLSFWFDGAESLYLVYVLGGESRKHDLSREVDTARFLVYSAETPFNWRSVLLTGSLSEVPDSELAPILDEMDIRWRPDIFERASVAEPTALYRFEIDEQAGIKHLGLPPGLEAPADESVD
jgi:nitroimidazol reductase NimA-like FMN-containing flavoprotein (pyridoxamine 5'-phosphate oxidase superfamily)